MPAADHRERIGTRKIAAARYFRHRLLASVDQVRVIFAFVRIWPDAEHAVFGLHDYLDAFRKIIRNQRGDSNAQVDVVAVAHFLRHAPRDEFPLVHFRRHYAPRFLFGPGSTGFRYFVPWKIASTKIPGV